MKVSQEIIDLIRNQKIADFLSSIEVTEEQNLALLMSRYISLEKKARIAEKLNLLLYDFLQTAIKLVETDIEENGSIYILKDKNIYGTDHSTDVDYIHNSRCIKYFDHYESLIKYCEKLMEGENNTPEYKISLSHYKVERVFLPVENTSSIFFYIENIDNKFVTIKIDFNDMEQLALIKLGYTTEEVNFLHNILSNKHSLPYPYKDKEIIQIQTPIMLVPSEGYITSRKHEHENGESYRTIFYDHYFDNSKTFDANEARKHKLDISNFLFGMNEIYSPLDWILENNDIYKRHC